MRTQAGFESARQAARALGVPEATYLQHERGARAVSTERFEEYAIFFRAKILLDTLDTLDGPSAQHEQVTKAVYAEIQEKLPGSGDWDTFRRKDPECAEHYRQQVDRLFRYLKIPLPPNRRSAAQATATRQGRERG